MGFRAEAAGSIAAIVRIVGIGMFLYGAMIFETQSPSHNPVTLAMTGALVAVFLPGFVRRVCETVLLVR